MSSIELRGFKKLNGLDDLLSASKNVGHVSSEMVVSLSVNELKPGKYQPRTLIPEEALKELALSIKSEGIIQPLIVRKDESNKYEIIAGERRWRAALLAGLKSVPAIIREISHDTALAFGLIENIQREGLNPIDEASALVKLKEEFSMTHEEIATRVGRSRSAVTNLMRLVLLVPSVKTLLKKGALEMGHARTLLTLESEDQHKLANQIAIQKLSVRETERLVQKLKMKPLATIPNRFQSKILEWESKLTSLFGSKVEVKLNNKGFGKISIQIDDPKQIESLIAQQNKI